MLPECTNKCGVRTDTGGKCRRCSINENQRRIFPN